MIDIHCHILYGLDDGARDLTESVQLCRDAYSNGFKGVVATPHLADYSHIAEFVRARNNHARILRDALKSENIPLALATGAELYLSDGIFTADSLDRLTINNSRYMLCELPLGPFDVEKSVYWIRELTNRGYRPILAHPERYIEFHRHPEIIDSILRTGALLQINLDSLLGYNGDEPQYMATDMAERGIARFIATDTHDPVYRHNRFKEKINEIPRSISNGLLIKYISRNPRLVLKNENI